jgi:hypothetical protein
LIIYGVSIVSKTKIVDIQGNQLPNISVPAGTFVVWRNLDAVPHSAETRREAEPYFNAGAMLPGATSSPILFDTPGTHEYLCRFHTAMFGTVNVDTPLDENAGNGHGGGHHGHGLNHYHGFVTGGRSAQRLYMTHTPVLADDRHNYQVILRGRFLDAGQSKLYEDLRNSPYGHGVMQVFHDHMSMPEIGMGNIKELPDASVSFYPGGRQTVVTGLEHVRIALDRVIHFHKFETDAAFPSEMTYLMYGDQDDVFIDHLIDRAPSFHSVAKLKSAPLGWTNSEAGALRFTVPGRKMRDMPARLLDRAAIVDNSFHLFWLLPPGFLERQAQDPLIRRPMGSVHSHKVRFGDGKEGEIEIEHFLHFDIRLLNYGVLIV